MFKKIFNNQSGISLVEVMVAAGISSVIALSTMKISTNSQKAMRKATVDADVSSYFNLTLRGQLSSNDACMALVGPTLNNKAANSAWHSISGGTLAFSAYDGGRDLSVGGDLPGFEQEFQVTALDVQRNSENNCRLRVGLKRKNTENRRGNKLGAKDRFRFVDVACGYDSSDNIQFCSSTDSADGGNSPWDRKLDPTPNGEHWVEYSQSNFPSAIIGAGNGSTPISKLTITNSVSGQAFKSGVDGIGLLNGNGIKWNASPLTSSNGVGITGDASAECINLFANTSSSATALRACASMVYLDKSTEVAGSLASSGNIQSGGNISASGQVAGATLSISGAASTGALTASSVTSPGAIQGASVRATGQLRGSTLQIDSTGTVSGALSSGSLSTGAVTAGAITASSLSTTGNVTVGGTLRANNISSVSGNINVASTIGSRLTVANTVDANYISAPGITAGNIYANSTSVFQGQVFMNSNLTVQGTFSNPSDRRLKDDIKETDLGLEFINSLKPVRYVYKKDKSDNPMYRIGLIAQDIQASIKKHSKDLKDKKSDIVIDNEMTGFLSVSYQSLISPIINAVKELFSQNKKQDKEIAQLKAENELLKSALCSKHENEFKFCDSRGVASEK